jgi:hypothetical protein
MGVFSTKNCKFLKIDASDTKLSLDAKDQGKKLVLLFTSPSIQLGGPKNEEIANFYISGLCLSLLTLDQVLSTITKISRNTLRSWQLNLPKRMSNEL